MAGKFHFDRKKKDTFVCLAGARSLLQPEKIKDTVVCLLGARFWLLRPENKRYSCLSGGVCCCVRKDTVVCLAGCAVVSVFGSGRKLAVFLDVGGKFYHDRKNRYSRLSGGCRIIIMTGKKRYSCLSGGCAIIITTEKKKIQ